MTSFLPWLDHMLCTIINLLILAFFNFVLITGTEIGGAFLSGCLLQPQAPSTFSTPTFGAAIVLVSEDGKQSPHVGGIPSKGCRLEVKCEITAVTPVMK